MIKILYVLLSTLLFSCATGPVSGILFTYTEFAGELNPEADAIPPHIRAIGCQYSFLGLLSFGDAGAGEIANGVGIKRIASIDHSTMSFLQIGFHRYCTIVTGAGY